MIEQVATSTKILQTEHLSADDFDRLIFYVGGVKAKACFIIDPIQIASRDQALSELKQKREIIIQDQVFPNPKVSDIMTMVDHIKDAGVNVIIGIGGGSTLDSAKGVAAILSNGGDLDDYLGPQPKMKIEKKNVTLILIPTTVGTGSEVTKVGVYTSRSGRKYTLGNPLLQADIAVLVAEYVYNLPAKIVASTAFDALTHALETLWNKNATPLSDRVAIESATRILMWMEKAYDSATIGQKEGIAQMLESANMAGIAFSMTGTAALHAISFILSEEWHVPHGIACAFSIEEVFNLNIKNEKVRSKLIEVAKSFFEGDDDQLIDLLFQKIITLKRKMGMPSSFKDLNVEMTQDKIKELFNKSLDDPKMKNNIVDVDENVLFDIINHKIY
ncbi:MAG: iron-containing alcohol dehydrogenase [Proteiniphilum sp.]